jgi:anthranilate synthase/aminodeoxychorismate synthase-like glutamine amidotransferase
MLMIVLIVDCYDSFTFNLYQQVGRLGGKPVVFPCDTPLDVLQKTRCDRIILSPGPGTPDDSGVCCGVLETMSRSIPTLGVCLGHQTICTAFGGEVVRAPHLMHGKTSLIRHEGTGIFTGIPTPFTATRYHSLVAQQESLPEELEVTASSLDDGYVMGVRHTKYPINGVQFHPESILSPEGDGIIRNFLYPQVVSP